MPSSINVVLQVAAIAAVTVMRAAQPGWLMIMFMLSVIGPLTVFGQVLTAMTALRVPRPPASLTVPFFVMPDTTGLAVTLLLVWGSALLWVRVVMDAKKAEFRRGEGTGPVGSPA